MSDIYNNALKETNESLAKLYVGADKEIKRAYEKISFDLLNPQDNVVNPVRLAKDINDIATKTSEQAYNIVSNLILSIKSNPEFANGPSMSEFLKVIEKYQSMISSSADSDVEKDAVASSKKTKYKDYIWTCYTESIKQQCEMITNPHGVDAGVFHNDEEGLKLFEEFFKDIIDNIDKAGKLEDNIYDIIHGMQKYQKEDSIRDEYDQNMADADNEYLFSRTQSIDLGDAFTDKYALNDSERIEDERMRSIYDAIKADTELLKKLAKEGGIDNARVELTYDPKKRLAKNCKAFISYADKYGVDEDIIGKVKKISNVVGDQLNIAERRMTYGGHADGNMRFIYHKTKNDFGKGLLTQDQLIEELGGNQAIVNDIKDPAYKNANCKDVNWNLFNEEDLGEKALLFRFYDRLLKDNEELSKKRKEIFNENEEVSEETKTLVVYSLAKINSVVQYVEKTREKELDPVTKKVFEKLDAAVTDYKDFVEYAFKTISADTKCEDAKKAKSKEQVKKPENNLTMDRTLGKKK